MSIFSPPPPWTKEDESSQICSVCQKVFTLSTLLNLNSVSFRHPYSYSSLENLEKQLLPKPLLVLDVQRIRETHSQCQVCRLIYTQLGDLRVGTLSVSRCAGKNEDAALYLEFRLPKSEACVATITLFANNNTPAAKYIPYRPIGKPGSQQTISTVKEWIQYCDQNHRNCRYTLAGARLKSSTKLPTRVLDVGSSQNASVHLLITKDLYAKYLALSHCWGGISHTRTTKDSLERHQKGVDISILSKTAQDAIHITRELGVRYLWIDSLCIVQDDKEDWLREARCMASVYEGAYCTIAATAAKDGTMGCYVPREAQTLVCLPCQPEDLDAGNMYFGVPDENAVEELLKGPLNSRAWVLQERLFSRRTIHFAADQVYWECDNMFVGENGIASRRSGVDHGFWTTRSLLYCVLEGILGSERMPRLSTPRPKDDFPFTKKEFYTIWAQLVRDYSRCGLTKDTDKLPALLSLSTELGKLIPDEYHEGHWFIRPLPLTVPFFFLSSLLWKTEGGAFLTKPALHRAPSWSWASLNGPLDWADMFFFQLVGVMHPGEYYLDVSAFQMWKPAGLPASEALLLSGLMSRVSLCNACHPTQNPSQQCSACIYFRQSSRQCEWCELPREQKQISLINDVGSRIAGTFVYDVTAVQPKEFWLLPIYCRRMGKDVPLICYVLLLEEVGGQKKAGVVFRRIGMGHVEDEKVITGGKKRFLVLI